MLKLKLQYFGHLIWRTDSLEKTGWDGWMASLTWWTWVWASFRRRWRTGKPGVLRIVHGVTKSPTWLSGWTTAKAKLGSQGCWFNTGRQTVLKKWLPLAGGEEGALWLFVFCERNKWGRLQRFWSGSVCIYWMQFYVSKLPFNFLKNKSEYKERKCLRDRITAHCL